MKGQVSVLDKAGAVVTRLGTNTGEGVGSNQLKPEFWKPGLVCRRTASPSTTMATCSSPNSTCLAASTASTASRRHVNPSHPARSRVVSCCRHSANGRQQKPASGIAPTGTLRAAFLATNPVQGRIDPQTGAVTGPVADLAGELARRLGVRVTLLPEPNPAAVIERVKNHQADIGFLAYEAARATQVEFRTRTRWWPAPTWSDRILP